MNKTSLRWFLGMLGLLLACEPDYGQTFGELRKELLNTPVDTQYVRALNRLAGNYRAVRIDSSLYFSMQAVRESRRLRYGRGEAVGLYNLGAATLEQGRTDTAIQVLTEAAQKAVEINHLMLAGACENALGAVFRSRREPQQALDHLFRSLEWSDRLADSLGMSYALANIGNVYFDQLDSTSARKFYRRALAISAVEEDPNHHATVLSNLSNVASSMVQRRQWLAQATGVALANADSASLVFIYNNWAGYYQRMAMPDSAQSSFERSYLMAKGVGDIYSMVAAANNLAELCLTRGQESMARDWLQRAQLGLARLPDRSEEYKSLSIAAALATRRGRFQQGYQLLREALTLKDSLHTQEVAAALAEAQVRYATQEKEAKLAQQELAYWQQRRAKERLRLFLILGLVGAAALTAGAYVLQSRRRQAMEARLALEQSRAAHLAELDALKSQFFQDISHELRTPLTLILGPLEGVLSQLKHADQRRDVAMALRNAGKMHQRVNELLDLARLEAGNLPINARPISIVPFLQRVVEAFGSFAESQQVQLKYHTELTPGELTLLLDPDKLERVINNLVHNAIKFSPVATAVLVSSFYQEREGVLQLDVQDSGPGIPTEARERIFERFFQTAIGEETTGSGIGLALARELTQLVGGTLTLIPAVEGAHFRLLWPAPIAVPVPAVNEEPMMVEPLPDEDRWTSGFQPQLLGQPQAQVLVVEDQPDMQQYLSSLLEPIYSVHVAANGTQALQLLHRRPVDLIISDVMMPGMDGYTFREALVKQESFRDLPFIFLTARVLPEDRIRAFQLGIDDYLVKPFHADELLARVSNLLQNRRFRVEAQHDQPSGDADWQLLRRAEEIVLAHLEDNDFGVADLATALNYSTRQLGRVLGRASGLSPVNFILELRLRQAYLLLQQRRFFTVAEVRYAVGIDSASYFTHKFTARFGINPVDLLRDDTLT
ncbi:MAG: response regulator [Lewinellaceae bacterium]|nr:response regulator [Lewinellaceae bacterium]